MWIHVMCIVWNSKCKGQEGLANEWIYYILHIIFWLNFSLSIRKKLVKDHNNNTINIYSYKELKSHISLVKTNKAGMAHVNCHALVNYRKLELVMNLLHNDVQQLNQSHVFILHWEIQKQVDPSLLPSSRTNDKISPL